MKAGTLKIAVAGVYHETNTFAPGLTQLDDFRTEWVHGIEAFTARYKGTRTSMGGIIDASETYDAKLIPGLYAAATPGGMVEAQAGDILIDNLIKSVHTDSDGLVLIMHGAMVTELCHDFEGECLRRLRERHGRDYPIAVTLDLHGNISPLMVLHADVIVGYDTYPHVDMYERAIEVFDLLVRKIRGEIRPVMAYSHAGMLVVPQGMMTGEGVMKKVMDRAFEIESDEHVLNVTVAGGFPYSDVPDAGMSFVVTTNGERKLAIRYADELSHMTLELKESFSVALCSPDEAVRQALCNEEGPVILAEGSDNVGGGAPADATHLLAHLKNLPARALAVICDPEAVRAALVAGVGGTFGGSVGGKSDRVHGNPIHIQGKVRLLFDGVYRHVGPYMTGQRAEMGMTAVVESGHLTLVLTEKRTAPWDIGHIRYVGLWPEDFKIIVVKSAIAWQTALGPFAKRVIQVDTPGCCSVNLNLFRYKHVRRPIYPLDSQ